MLPTTEEEIRIRMKKKNIDLPHLVTRMHPLGSDFYEDGNQQDYHLSTGIEFEQKRKKKK
jgi:hypothetical protein